MRHSSSRPSRIYLDYAAGTPVAPEVFAAIRPYFSEKFGNPGSLHSFGQEALAAVDRAREIVAAALDAKFREIIFTGSATEANNLALRGAIRMLAKNGGGAKPRLIVSAVEHESVLETARALKKEGVEVAELPVDKNGIVKLNALSAALSAGQSAGGKTLVSIMYANNETGAIQPIAKIAKMVHDAGSLLHVDAAQAFQFLNCSVDYLGADFLTLSGHKIYGPKGVGVLYVRGQNNSSKVSMLNPILTGGGQEFGLRSGTENVPLVVGLAAAVEYIEESKEKDARRIAALKDKLFSGIKKIYPRAELNGDKSGKDCLPNIANVWLPGKSAEDSLIRLDLAGVAVSAGSACTARSSQPSHVLRAMGFNEARARQSLRFSIGRPTTEAEIKAFLGVFGKILTKRG